MASQDDSELKDRLAAAEERLRESEARHQLLIESWTQAVWETDAAGVVVADSPSWRAYTGQTVDEWLGYGWLDAIHPDDRAFAERQWREAMAAHSVVDAEFRFRSSDGGWRWTNVRAAPVLGADRRIEKWVGVNIDIDDRKRAEAALRESEAGLQTVFETIDAGFCIVEVVRGEEGRVEDLKFVATNRALEKQTGLVDVVGKNVLDVIPGYDRRWLSVIDEVATSGKPQRVEDYQPALGCWYDGYFTPVSGAGSSLVAVVFNDVSAQKQAELMVRESEERQAFLLRLSDVLRPLTDATAIQQAAVDLLGEHLGVGRAGYYGVETDQNAFFLTARWEREAIPLPDRMLISDFGDEIREGYLAGRTMVARDTEQDAATDDNLEAVRAIRVRAWIGVPLVKAGRWVAAVGVHSSTPRDWTQGEIRLVEEVGERTWAATERAHAEEAQRETEARYHALFAASPVPFMVLAANPPDYTITAANEAYYAATLTTPETLIGRRLFDVFTDDPTRPGQLGSEALDISLEKVMRTRQTDAMERVRYDIVTPEGAFEPHWWLAINAPLLDSAGDVAAIIHQVDRQTELHYAEEARRESEERLRQFGEASQDVLWIRDARTLRWTYLTPAFETIYGVSREAALAGDNFRNWMDLIVPEDRERAVAAIERVRDGELAVFEYRVRRPNDGAICWLRNTDFPIFDGNGQVASIGGIGHDITRERESADRQQVLVAELQHRTRNLMGVVRSMADRTIETSHDLSDFRVRFRDRLAALARVQGLLSRLEEHDRVTFDELIRTELTAMGGEVDKITLEGPDGVRLRSSMVQTLAMAMHELATNAVKYGAFQQPEGHLDVRWSLAPPDARGRPWLSIDWRESGVAMPTGATAPQGTGQGRELIEEALPYQLGAKTSFTFEEDGVHCTISLPVSASNPVLEEAHA